MEMTPAQIASEYRTGKDKTKTIKVLAELNAVTQRTIAEILQEQGETLPGHWIEKLAQPLQRKPRGRAMTPKEVDSAILEAVMPGGNDTSSGPSGHLLPAPLLSAGDDISPAGGITLKGEGMGNGEPAMAPAPAREGAALSMDGDPASRAGRISWAQYSRLANLIGRLDGAGCALPDPVALYYYDTLELLIALADEIKPIVDGETDCHTSLRTGSQ